MNYISTRATNSTGISAAAAIKQGLADDGGLFMPDEIPSLTFDKIDELRKLDYAQRAAYILSLYLTDYTYDELLCDCQKSYSDARFPGGAAPLVNIGDNLNSLELWHGPTSAFKDMALQIMPRLLSRALVKTGEKRNAFILVATSGDTGKAALEGYRDVDRVGISVFYPVDGVSRVQKRQMATQEGGNVFVTAVKGNFDDAQTGVKKIFSNSKAASKLDEGGYFFSSANSINWGRLAPQIAYYVSAYCDLINNGTIKNGDEINVCVPTGNFGNIFAAYLAYKMGLPVNKFICASNTNNILTDFLSTGKYDRNREFHTTMSPSMDILISSNLERLLYLVAGPERTCAYMKSLNETGAYTVDDDVRNIISQKFVGLYASEENTSLTIKETFNNSHYLSDTHTAVAIYCAKEYISKTDDKTPMVIASTASPYKFASNVLRSITGTAPDDEFEALTELNKLSGVEIPKGLACLRDKEERFKSVINPDSMLDTVYSQLNL